MMKKTAKPSSTTYLRRLILLLVVLAGIYIYSYGVRVTDIDLSVPQDPQRQAPLSRAMRELLSPNIFTQKTSSELVKVYFQVGNPQDCELADNAKDTLELDVLEPNPILDYGDEPYIILSKFCGFSDDVITVSGYNFRFDPRNSGILRWRLPNNTIPLTRFEVAQDGTFEQDIVVPKVGRISRENKIQSVEAESFIPTGPLKFSNTSKIVFDKIIETIFLALIATTISVPISILVSFLAARNLMKQIYMPFGNVLMMVIFFPVGWGIGLLFYNVVLKAILEDSIIGVALLVAILILLFFGRLVLAGNPLPKELSRIINWSAQATLLIAVLVLITLLGQVGTWINTQVDNEVIDLAVAQISMKSGSPLSDIGLMFGTILELFELLLPLFAALSTALLVAGISSSATASTFKSVPSELSSLLGGVMGAIAFGIILYGLAEFSHQAALLILLLPVIAGFIGGKILTLAYTRINPPDIYAKPKRSEETFKQALSIIGWVVIFLFVFKVMNVERGFFDGRRPLTEKADFLGFSLYIYSIRALLIGMGLGALVGLLSGVRDNFPIGMTIYNVNRTILNILRSIEPLIMGIIFVIWVGIGPFAGMLALALHSIASLGKLYSEQVENIDQGPIEAILATGANRLQMVVYAVIPQIVPPYIAFTMYRWDINVRMSTIIGFVGGGGIGFLLSQQINQLRYSEAGVAVLAIAIVVTILDYTSAYIREKMI
jgi:phosphonate ABC transporter permease subunit PhnE